MECTECGTQFKDLVNMARHVRKHTQEGTFICTSNTCKERFNTLEARERHLAENKLEKCAKCEKVCHAGLSIRTHLLYHGLRKPKKKKPSSREKKSWVCEKCGKSFSDGIRLQLHYLSHTGPESWEFMCSVCSKKCMTAQKLEEHMRTHFKQKPFTCEHCGLSYAHRHNLRIHINSKHWDVAKDKPRIFDKKNLSSRKGVKLTWNSKAVPTETKTKSRAKNGEKRKRTNRRKRKLSCSSDSD